jgi:hypothetical protein
VSRPSCRRRLNISIQRYGGAPESQNRIWEAPTSPALAIASFSQASSPVLAAAFGGADSRNSRPDVSTHGFHKPAAGSIMAALCGRAGVENRAKTINVDSFDLFGIAASPLTKRRMRPKLAGNHERLPIIF